MQFHQTSFLQCYVFVTALVLVGVTASAWADKIQFSKPAVEIAAPAKEQENLPQPRSKGLDLAPSQQMDRPPIQQPPPPTRVQPRDRDEDDDANRHPLLRDPKNFPDAVGRDNARNPKPRNSRDPDRISSTSSLSDALRNKETEPQNALSPIKDPNWDPRDRKDTLWGSDALSKNRFDRSATTEQADSNKQENRQDLYATREESSQQNDPFNSPAVLDPFTARPRENPIEAQLERRAEFEQVLNLNGNAAPKPSSLDPVTRIDVPQKPTGPLGMPMLGPARVEKPVAEAANAFNSQPGRLPGSLSEDLGKKYSSQSKPTLAPPIDARFQTPLMRQPTVHEIPARKF